MAVVCVVAVAEGMACALHHSRGGLRDGLYATRSSVGVGPKIIPVFFISIFISSLLKFYQLFNLTYSEMDGEVSPKLGPIKK